MILPVRSLFHILFAIAAFDWALYNLFFRQPFTRWGVPSLWWYSMMGITAILVLILEAMRGWK